MLAFKWHINQWPWWPWRLLHAFFNGKLVTSQKRWEIRPRLLLITNRKWHTPFQMKWKSLSLDDWLSRSVTTSAVGITLATAGLFVNVACIVSAEWCFLCIWLQTEAFYCCPASISLQCQRPDLCCALSIIVALVTRLQKRHCWKRLMWRRKESILFMLKKLKCYHCIFFVVCECIYEFSSNCYCTIKVQWCIFDLLLLHCILLFIMIKMFMLHLTAINTTACVTRMAKKLA